MSGISTLVNGLERLSLTATDRSPKLVSATDDGFVHSFSAARALMHLDYIEMSCIREHRNKLARFFLQNATAYHARRVHKSVSERMGKVPAQGVHGPVGGSQVGRMRAPATGW